MPYSFYLFLFIALIFLSLIILLIAHYKKNSHTQLYKQGVRNENEGHYSIALQNYQEVLSEVKKLKMDNKFGKKIAERIKILQTTVDYEKNFLNSRN
jgi:hypothetical protein